MQLHCIIYKKNSTAGVKTFSIIANLLHHLSHLCFFPPIRPSIETPVRQVHCFVSLCCNRISRLPASPADPPQPIPIGTSQIAAACISSEYSALPPTPGGFSISLENEGSTRGLRHNDHSLSRSPRSATTPPAPSPPTPRSPPCVLWQDGCRPTQFAVSEWGQLRETRVPSFCRHS